MDKKIGAIGMILFLGWAAGAAASSWQEGIASRLHPALENAPAGGEFGLYVRDLGTGAAFSLGAEKVWYLASGVKIPVAIELLRQVEEGELDLDQELRLGPRDYIDGSGETNFLEPGTKVSLRFLLEQMLIHSDNTASDLLIRAVGLEKVNALVARLAPGGFREITTLADVRRHAYSGIHPLAFGLKNQELMKIRGSDRSRKKTLAELLGLDRSKLKGKSVSAAFSTYYAKGLNSARLSAYGELLRMLAEGKALSASGTKDLLGIMERVETGKKRILAGLGGEIAWAHKTGTQYRRVCDFGLAWKRENPGHKVVIAACAAGYSKAVGERLLRNAGRAIADSGIFSRHNP